MNRRAGWTLLARELQPERRALGRVAAWSLLEALPALLSGLLVAAALDRGFLAGRPLAGLGWLGLLGLARLAGAIATRRLYPWLGELVEPLRDSLASAVVRGALARDAGGGMGTGGAGSGAGAEVARLAEQVEAVRQLLSALLRTLRQVVLTLLASLVGMAALAPAAGLLVEPPLALALALYAVSLRRLGARQRDLVLAGEQVPRIAAEIFGGLRDVLACGAGDHALATTGAAVERQARAARALARAGAIRVLVVAVGAQLPVVALLSAAPWLLRHHRLSAGAMAGTVVYLTTSLEPALRTLVHVTGTWGLQLSVTLRRLAETTTPPATGTALDLDLDLDLDLNLGPTVELEAAGLTFAYSATADPVLRDLALRLRPGDHLAVVGPSGAGKSTLAALLAGLAQPQRGEVRLGGVPIPQLDPATTRRAVALIPQEAYVFTGTLRENLTYLCPTEPGDAALDDAAAAVGLDATVARLGGYGAHLSSGGRELSAGERQLVALARTYLSPAGIVLLDEAACHLDPAAEARAEQAFTARPGALLVIAHRISSALRADRVLLLDGATALLGTHQELLAASPLYADLVGHWQGQDQAPDAEADADADAVTAASSRPA